MKKVFSDSSQVAHLWANKIQDEARNTNGSLYFYKDKIYSYGGHFVIAKHAHVKGRDVVLFTTRRYSNTTAKHIGITGNACSHLEKIYVPFPDDNADKNVVSLLQEAQIALSGIAKAKKPQIYVDKANYFLNLIDVLVDLFDYHDMDNEIAAIRAVTSKDEYAKLTAEQAERARIREEERERKRLLDHQENVSKWLNGESHVLYSRIDHRDYLRLSGDVIETSQGIKMSIQEARVLQSVIKADRLKMGDKVLDFTVIEVSDRVRIGCHTFPKEYLINFKLD